MPPKHSSLKNGRVSRKYTMKTSMIIGHFYCQPWPADPTLERERDAKWTNGAVTIFCHVLSIVVGSSSRALHTHFLTCWGRKGEEENGHEADEEKLSARKRLRELESLSRFWTRGCRLENCCSRRDGSSRSRVSHRKNKKTTPHF